MHRAGVVVVPPCRLAGARASRLGGRGGRGGEARARDRATCALRGAGVMRANTRACENQTAMTGTFIAPDIPPPPTP